MKTWKNNRYLGFRGIKYAEPPTGSRRFMVIIDETIALKMPIIRFIPFDSGTDSDPFMGKSDESIRR